MTQDSRKDPVSQAVRVFEETTFRVERSSVEAAVNAVERCVDEGREIPGVSVLSSAQDRLDPRKFILFAIFDRPEAVARYEESEARRLLLELIEEHGNREVEIDRTESSTVPEQYGTWWAFPIDVWIDIDPAKIDDFYDVWDKIMTTPQKGLLRFEMLPDAKNRARVLVSQIWESRVAWAKRFEDKAFIEFFVPTVEALLDKSKGVREPFSYSEVSIPNPPIQGRPSG